MHFNLDIDLLLTFECPTLYTSRCRGLSCCTCCSQSSALMSWTNEHQSSFESLVYTTEQQRRGGGGGRRPLLIPIWVHLHNYITLEVFLVASLRRLRGTKCETLLRSSETKFTFPKKKKKHLQKAQPSERGRLKFGFWTRNNNAHLKILKTNHTQK